jgi:hypothetical protein
LDIQQSLFRNYDESFFPEGNTIMTCQSGIRKFVQKARWAWERGMKLRWEYTTQEETEELPIICFHLNISTQYLRRLPPYKSPTSGYANIPEAFVPLLNGTWYWMQVL